MTVIPVIVRELRASSRSRSRTICGLLAVGALLLLTSLIYALDLTKAFGRQLFGVLHHTLFGAIWSWCRCSQPIGISASAAKGPWGCCS